MGSRAMLRLYFSTLAAIFSAIYDPKNGLFNALLGRPPGQEILWLGDQKIVIWSIVIALVWQAVGYYMVMYLASLQGVPAELYEAATVDGASGWQKFWKVTLPMLTPTTFFVSIMLVITCGVTFVKLYKASGSWFSALALLMLFATASASFKRD